MAWLTNWNRRKQLYLNGTSAGAQSSYQMKITINYGAGTDSVSNIYCGGNVKSDFSDIRFTDIDGTTLLYYWIESYTASTSAIVWIKIPNIPTGSNSANIYIYYNNPTPPSDGYNSGINTFAFFDDFTGSAVDLTKWTGSTSGSGISVSNSVISYVGSGTWRKIYSTSTFKEGIYALRTMSRFIGPSPVNADIGYEPNPCCNGRTILYGYGYLSYDDSGNGQNSGVIYSSSTWYIFDILINGGANVKFYRNGILDYTASTVPSGNLLQPVELGAGNTSNEVDVDWVLIRLYSNPEPTWSSNIGTEQLPVTLNITSNPVTGAEIWLASPSGAGYVDQHLQTNNTITVLPGNYDLKLTHAGYLDYILSNQNWSSGQTYDIPATLLLIPGSLAISSTPSGAEIWLGGVDRGVTTAPAGTTIPNLNPGPYNITLKLTGYQDWTGTYTVNTNSTTNVSATFAGSAYITSTPSNAEIYLAISPGSPADQGVQTPHTITNLTSTVPGSTTIWNYKLRLSGYSDTSGSFTATAGQTINVPVTFPGSLYITSMPEGASVYIDGVLQ